MSSLSIPPNAQLEEMMRGAGPLPDQTNLPFPASTRQAAGVLGGVSTEVMSVSFSDKILVTISQNGKLGQWLHVPLENTNPGTEGYHTLPNPNEDGLLPLPNFTATSVLGARGTQRETVGQLYACQIATAIATKNPNEKRLLVVGLGLEQTDLDRDIFFGVIDLTAGDGESLERVRQNSERFTATYWAGDVPFTTVFGISARVLLTAERLLSFSAPAAYVYSMILIITALARDFIDAVIISSSRRRALGAGAGVFLVDL